MLLVLFLAFIAILYTVSWRADAPRTRRAFVRSGALARQVLAQVLAVLLASGLVMLLWRRGPSPHVLERVHGPFAVVAGALASSASTGGPIVAYPIAGAL